MDDLAELSRIRVESYNSRALECARRIINNFDDVDDVKCSKLITQNVIYEKTILAFEIAAAIYKAVPLIPLDITRKVLRCLVQEVFCPLQSTKADLLSTDCHTLLTDWLVLAMLSPIEFKSDILSDVSSYALSVDRRVGTLKAGRLVGVLIARGGASRQTLLEQVPERLRLSVLAKTAMENVTVETGWLDLMLADKESSSVLEPDEEVLLLVAMRTSPRFANCIQRRGETSLVPRVSVEAGRSLYHCLASANTAVAYAHAQIDSLRSAKAENLGQWHLMMYAFLNELFHSTNITVLSLEDWVTYKNFLLVGLDHENLINKARSAAIHQEILTCLWNLLKSRQISVVDIPSFLVPLLRLALWHFEGLTRHRANSVLQEAIGRYGLHSACDIIPNLESLEETGLENEILNYGASLARRYLPIARHSPLAYEGSVIAGIETLLTYDQPAYFRHCSTIHHLLQDRDIKHIPKSQFIDSIIGRILSNSKIDTVLDINKWQHTRYLALLVALITVADYIPSPLISQALCDFAIALADRWTQIRISSCVPTRGNLDIHCHHSAIVCYAVRYWCTVAAATSCFHERPELDTIISAILAKHECTGGKLAYKEWLHVRRLQSVQPNTIDMVIKAQTFSAMRLIEVLPFTLADCAANPALFSQQPQRFLDFFEKQRVRILQNCIPICVVVIYLDLCGLARIQEPRVFEEQFRLTMTQAVEHPEPAVRALGREWLDFKTNSVTTDVNVGDRVYWRMRNRRIGPGCEKVNWKDLYGDVETIRMRPFTSPTFFHTAHSAVVPQTLSFNLLGTSNCIAQSKAIVRDWGRSNQPNLFAAYANCLGPWERDGCFYALVLRSLRHPAAGEGGNSAASMDFKKIASRDDLMQLLSTDLGSPQSAPMVFELSLRIAEVSVSLGIVS